MRKAAEHRCVECSDASVDAAGSDCTLCELLRYAQLAEKQNDSLFTAVCVRGYSMLSGIHTGVRVYMMVAGAARAGVDAGMGAWAPACAGVEMRE
jgi:hypothetical protein